MWNCSACTFLNEDSRSKCELCFTSRPGPPRTLKQQKLGNLFKPAKRKSSLTEEQRLRIEENKRKALEKRRQLKRKAKSAKLPPTKKVKRDKWHKSVHDEDSLTKFVANCRAKLDAKIPMMVDKKFPPKPGSIDGRGYSNDSSTESFQCRCKKDAKLQKVYKEGPNQNKLFWCCKDRKCGFFQWAKKGSIKHTKDAESAQWTSFRYPEYKLVGTSGCNAKSVLQGGVGDCWFLSAIAVIVEREDLVDRIMISNSGDDSHQYSCCFFFNGRWTLISVDSFLPCHSDGLALKFAKTDQSQVWVPFLEKCYAKLHGSYAAISGGEIAEALFDLTGMPTETISFNDSNFDSEETWARLLSMKSGDGFPMGIATAGGRSKNLSSVGLVGCHAYSVLDIKEVHAKLGAQPKLNDFLEGRSMDTIEVLRMVKIRNPWGNKEWRGEFGSKCEKWTSKLSQILGKNEIGKGVFWMSWSDVMMYFELIDVLKAHRDWFSIIIPNKVFGGSTSCGTNIRLQILEPTWLYISLIRNTKRGCTESYWYPDVAAFIFAAGTPVALFFSGEQRTSHHELNLEHGEYDVVFFNIHSQKDSDFYVKIFSSRPVEVKLDISSPHRLFRHFIPCTFIGVKSRLVFTSQNCTVTSFDSNGSCMIMCHNESHEMKNLVLNFVQEKMRIVSCVNKQGVCFVPGNSQRLLLVATSADRYKAKFTIKSIRIDEKAKPDSRCKFETNASDFFSPFRI